MRRPRWMARSSYANTSGRFRQKVRIISAVHLPTPRSDASVSMASSSPMRSTAAMSNDPS